MPCNLLHFPQLDKCMNPTIHIKKSVFKVFLVTIFLSVVACGSGDSQSDSDPGAGNQNTADPIDVSNGPFLFGQNLFTSVIPTRIVTTSNGGTIVTTRELNYTSATRTLTQVSVTSSGENIVSGALEINYEFNDQGQVTLETHLTNGSLSQVVNYEYVDNLLVRVEYRTTFDGEPDLVGTLNYDDAGRLAFEEIIRVSEDEIIRTSTREYTESGWVSTINRGGLTNRIVNTLNENGQIIRSVETVTAGSGGLTRTTTQSFDENNLRLTRRRFGRGELITENQYLDYVNIDTFIHDRIYQWQVFFDASAF